MNRSDSRLRRSLTPGRAALLVALLAACGEPAPVEIDGDRIRAMVAEVGARTSGAAQAERRLLELAARSPEARSLVFREVDRAHRAAALGAEETLAAELAAVGSGRPIDPSDQSRVAALVHARAEAERCRDALERLLTKLR